MRLPVLAAFLLSVLTGGAAVADAAGDGWFLTSPDEYVIGTEETAGISGKQAVYVRGTAQWYGPLLQREISLQAWRGKRVRLSLRLKDGSQMRGWSRVAIWNVDGSGVVARGGTNAWGRDDWQAHSFVLDVPDNADHIAIAIGLRPEGVARDGTIWVDGTALEAVDKNVRTTPSFRRLVAPYKNNQWLDGGITHGWTY